MIGMTGEENKQKIKTIDELKEEIEQLKIAYQNLLKENDILKQKLFNAALKVF